MADVSIRNVTKQFGKSEVIHGISCDIRDGEFIVILGPSGCGKSTLLRMSRPSAISPWSFKTMRSTRT